MCASPALCECTKDGGACAGGIDALGCGVPVCMPNLDSGEMPLRCAPGDIKQVEICDASLNGWTLLETCSAEEFCYPADRTAPCQIECPAPLLCNGAELLSCTVKGPPVHQADCATPTLCECAVAGTCPIFPNGCGIPQCGGTLPQHQCDGATLQTCQVGRAGWDEQNCGDSALCYPGVAPAFTGGYCAICPTAGVVDCNAEATGIRTCSPDRLGYVAEMTCALGCLPRPGASADYCAVCAEGELRCNGAAPGMSRVRECNDDRAGLTDVGAVCEHGCLDMGIADQCAACQMGESRCMGNQRWLCNSARTALTLQETCTQACINSGIADYCGMCAPGNTQCDGDLLQTCQNNGSLNTGTNCPNGCVTTSPTAAACAPTCRPGTYRCASSTMPAAPDGAQLQQCNATGTGWTLIQTCGSAALCDEQNHECDDCTSGDYNCNAGTLRSCNASGHWASTGGTNCSGTTLRTCGGPGRNTVNTETCASAGLCNETEDRCDQCNVSGYSCSAGALRSCDVTTGQWVPEGTRNCFPPPSGNTLYTCSGSTLTGPTTCTICDDTDNQCDVCSPGAYSCSAGTLRRCNSTGQGYDPGIACEGTTLRSCSGSTLSTSQCPAMMPTCNSAQTACVSGCTNGTTRCSVNTLQTCVGQEWVSDSSPCANGCFGGAGPNAYCGVCSSGTQCMGSQPQTCSMGQWTNMGTACSGANPVCVGSTGTCVACTAMNSGSCTAMQVCLSNECVECATSADCTGEVCRTSDHTCVACTPTDVTACPTNAKVCSNNTCVECTSNANCTGEVCRTSDNTCVACTPTDVTACPANAKACSNNTCVECTTNANCTDEVCRTSDNTCVACTATDTSECAPATPACFNNQCVACLTTADCSGALVCRTASHTCVECLTDTECPGERCNTASNTCVECLTDADCMPDVETCSMGVCELVE
jgi:Cys-rich repeat protein